MKNILEWINRSDIDDMHLVLENQYAELMGIDLIKSDHTDHSDMIYVLKDPSKLPFSHHFRQDFI